jgi:type III restriction enzyme
MIYKYLAKNDYIGNDDSVTQEYRDDLAAKTLAPLPEALQPMAEGIHRLVQAIFDDSVLNGMFEDGNKTKAPENPLITSVFTRAFQDSVAVRSITAYAYYRWTLIAMNSSETPLERLMSTCLSANFSYTVSQASQRDAINADMLKEATPLMRLKP